MGPNFGRFRSFGQGPTGELGDFFYEDRTPAPGQSTAHRRIVDFLGRNLVRVCQRSAEQRGGKLYSSTMVKSCISGPILGGFASLSRVQPGSWAKFDGEFTPAPGQSTAHQCGVDFPREVGQRLAAPRGTRR